MNWNENKSEYPPEEKTPDGIGMRKSVKVLLLATSSKTKEEKILNVAFYDYLKSKWMVAHNFKEWLPMSNLTAIAWCEINNIPVNKPNDKQEVKFTDCQHITRTGTYIESEDIFLINDMDFVFRQFVNSWTPIKTGSNENSK